MSTNRQRSDTSPVRRCRQFCYHTKHRLGSAIWLPVAAEGATMQMMLGNGFGFNWQGLYVTSMVDFHSGWRSRADELSDSLKSTMLIGHCMVTRHRGHYYAKAQNLARRLRRPYDLAAWPTGFR
jgi:amidase